MKNELIKIDNKGVNVIDSREVAEMLGKEHSELMKDIKGSGKNKGIIPILEKGDINIKEYFIESTYRTTGNNKTYNCYLVTRMGCEMLGSKLQGEKSILFKSRMNSIFNELNLLESIEKITKDFKYIKRKEVTFIEQLEDSLRPFGISGVNQYYQIKPYRIDYYIPSLNIAIEYDENNHRNYTYEQHEGRQKEIEDKLGCRFIRVSDKNSNEYNIGYIIKEMFNININNVA